MTYIAGSSWFVRMTDAGYDVRIVKGKPYGNQQQLALQAWKDGKLVHEENEKGRGLGTMAEALCNAIGLGPMNGERPVGLQIEEATGTHKSVRYSHDSFGLAVFNRFHGSQRMFGSPVDTMGGVSLQIKRAYLDHSLDLGNERYFGKEQVCEIRMTHSQFAELITSFGKGDGVPVTIMMDAKGQYEPVETVSFEDRVRSIFERRMEEVSAEAETAAADAEKTLSTPGPLKASEKSVLLRQLQNVARTVRGTAPWLLRVYDDHMATKTQHARTEFAHWARKYAGDQEKLAELAMKTLPEVIETEAEKDGS